MCQNRQQNYAFERHDTRNLDLLQEPKQDDEVEFARRLGFDLKDESQCSPRARRVIGEFVEAVHRNILWYVKRRKREVGWYRCYMGLTAGMVVIVPAVSVLIPAQALDSVLQPEATVAGTAPDVPTSVVVSAQLTALIAGIYGIHRLFSTWLFRRNSAHAFWKASAELKEILYGIEGRWRGQTLIDGALDHNFLRDLTQAKAAAQEIVKSERNTFFAAYEKVSADLQGIVTKGTTGAAAVVGKIADPILKKVAEQERRKADQRAAITAARGRIVNLLTQRRQLNEQVARSQAMQQLTKDAGHRRQLIEQLQRFQKDLAAVARELTKATARYQEKWALYAE